MKSLDELLKGPEYVKSDRLTEPILCSAQSGEGIETLRRRILALGAGEKAPRTSMAVNP